MAKKSDEAAGAAEEKVSVKKHDKLDKILGGKVFDAIRKKHGMSIICSASEHHASRTQYIRTPSLALNWTLGGGFRVGGIHTVWGPKSSGKTTTLLATIGEAQQMCANCWGYAEFCDPKTGEIYKTPKCECGKYRQVVVAYINTEPGSWDPKWAGKLGVNLDTLLYSEPEYAQQSLDIGEALLREGNIDILALDSLAFMTPEQEIEKSASEETMGLQPRVLGKGVRKFAAALNYLGNHQGRIPTIFFTNQVRMRLGMLFGNPETQPGGMAPQFAATTEIKFKAVKYEIEKDKDAEADKVSLNLVKPLSALLSWRAEKNKQGTPMLDGMYRLALVSDEYKKKGEIYDEPVIMAEAERCGIVKKEGSKWTCAGVPFDSKKMIEETLFADKAFKRLLSQRILDQLLAD